MTKEELLTTYKNGQRNFSNANLRWANLRWANLQGAIGNNKEVKSLQLDTWNIVYTNEILAIGCKQYTIEKWKNFTNHEINIMHIEALIWWKKWKPIIFNIIEMTNK